MSQPALHVVFGAGQIGARLARSLAARGHRVRVVRRSAKAVGHGIELVTGDARDPAFATRAAEGAAVVYHCMNPSAYRDRAWAEELPPLGEALIAAAQRSGARLVVLDNLYGYGPQDVVLTEETAMAPVGQKGALRAAWDARLREAGHAGLRYVVGRAGDFFGPGAEEAVLGEDAVRRLAAGKRVLALGDPDAPHAFGYVPDVVEGLAALGTAEPDVEGQVFHLPVLEASPRALHEALAQALGTRARRIVLGALALFLLGLFVPVLRELRQTLYQWDRPFRASDARFRARFPSLGTPRERAIAETAAAARSAVAPPRAAQRLATSDAS